MTEDIVTFLDRMQKLDGGDFLRDRDWLDVGMNGGAVARTHLQLVCTLQPPPAALWPLQAGVRCSNSPPMLRV